MNGHKLQSIKVQEVALVPHPSSDEPTIIYFGEPQEAIGCEVCGAPYEAVLRIPCPKEVRLQAVTNG